MSNIVNKEEAKINIIEGKLVIMDFFATWCGPCQMMLPIFEELSVKQDGVIMSKLDIDKDPEYASKNNVMQVPTIIAFKNGKEVARLLGFKPEKELQEFINSVKL